MAKQKRKSKYDAEIHPEESPVRSRPNLSYLTEEQKLAYELYVRQRVQTYKEIAARVGVSASTISRWVDKFEWKAQRAKALRSPDVIADHLLEIIDAEIWRMDHKAGGIDAGDIDKLSKLVSALQKIAPNRNFFGSILKAVEEWMQFLQRHDPEVAKNSQQYLMRFSKEMAEKYDY